jgi:hypothetical protein
MAKETDVEALLDKLYRWDGGDVRDVKPILDEIISVSTADSIDSISSSARSVLMKVSPHVFWSPDLPEHSKFYAVDANMSYITCSNGRTAIGSLIDPKPSEFVAIKTSGVHSQCGLIGRTL